MDIQKESSSDIVQTKTTRKARRLLKMIAAAVGRPMQTEAERIFEAELERINREGVAGPESK